MPCIYSLFHSVLFSFHICHILSGAFVVVVVVDDSYESHSAILHAPTAVAPLNIGISIEMQRRQMVRVEQVNCHTEQQEQQRRQLS